jgi:uncharacterized hydantoinase/oxoprolinase family protein
MNGNRCPMCGSHSIARILCSDDCKAKWRRMADLANRKGNKA